MKARINGVEVEGSVSEIRELLGIGGGAAVRTDEGDVRKAQTFAVDNPRDQIQSREEMIGMLTKLLGMDEGNKPPQAPPAGASSAQGQPQPAPEAPIQNVPMPNGTSVVLNGGLRLASRAEVQRGDGTGPKGSGGEGGKGVAFGGMDPRALIEAAENNPMPYAAPGQSERSGRSGRRR